MENIPHILWYLVAITILVVLWKIGENIYCYLVSKREPMRKPYIGQEPIKVLTATRKSRLKEMIIRHSESKLICYMKYHGDNQSWYFVENRKPYDVSPEFDKLLDELYLDYMNQTKGTY